jgi:tetratricopeptide (TPR) repeat protein
MKNLICELILSCVVASAGVRPLDELTYGNVLYSYYQDDHQQALLDTMVAQTRGRTGEDPVRFQLARGSFAFSERMFSAARSAFEAVDPEQMTELDRMRLAFHLAREYHRRGNYPAMSGQLEKIELGRSWSGRARIHPEVAYMRSEAAMAAGQLEVARALLQPLEDGEPLLAYGLFNLGVAFRSAGDNEAARETFGRLAGMKASNAETRDLVARARLALAWVAREQQAMTDAQGVLGDLPGSGRYRDAALASYGDLAMDNEDYELAARIWLTLQNQGYWTASTAQARLAFPVSLERLASREQALEQYRAAEATFESRLVLLDDLSRQAEDPKWIRSLLMVFAAPEQDREQMSELVASWRERLGHTDWLEWLAAEDTHQVLSEWRELVTMNRWLDRLPPELAAFEQVTAERRRRGAAARQLLVEGALLEQRTTLAVEVDRQAAVLDRLSSMEPERHADWMRQLATPAELGLISELEQARTLASRHLSDADRRAWLGRIDRLQGILFWQIADDATVRLQKLRRAQEENVVLLEDLDGRIARVASAEAEFVAGVETDYLAFADRAAELTSEVAVAVGRRELALADEIKRGMAREMKEVQRYLLATRIGIARATDHLSMAADTVEGE